jgi:hypothetical protein
MAGQIVVGYLSDNSEDINVETEVVCVVALRVELSPDLRTYHHILACLSGQMIIQLNTANAAIVMTILWLSA